jgi:hypothetical protein
LLRSISGVLGARLKEQLRASWSCSGQAEAIAGRLALEKAVRNWAAFDPAARAAVQATDRRRLDYVEGLFRAAGFAGGAARARTQIIYWAFIGFALSDEALPPAKQHAVLDELLRFASK